MAIERLTLKDALTSATVFAINVNGQDYRILSSSVLEYMQDNLVFPSIAGGGQFETQYAAPSSSGFSVTIAPTTQGDNVHLILTPTAGYAAGTIVLPDVAEVADKQEVLVNCTQQVTALTVDGNGAVAVTGEPASLGADDFFRLKYDIITQTWFRVG